MAPTAPGGGWIAVVWFALATGRPRSSLARTPICNGIEAPAFDEAQLSVSDLVLGTRANTGSLPEAPIQVPIDATTTRAFIAGSPVSAFLRIYRASDAKSGSRVSADATVLDADGRAIRHQSLSNVTFTGRTADVRIGVP